ncbi:MAG: hypothetical protein B6D79_16700 [gamma proteobacterium symbiont of Ctena orbiculata]|nr:MAG: hypothetical protein B6D79_16700 [gamma proteobacterium symbiont of Ctena orbiculata]
MTGRFNAFSGEIGYTESKPSEAKIEAMIDTGSIDSNHAERDKHFRDEDFLNVAAYPEARFISTSYIEEGKDKTTLIGDLTLKGITRPIRIEVEHVDAGTDPWDGLRIR